MDEHEWALNEEGRELWDRKAAFWDELHGEEGNNFHQWYSLWQIPPVLAGRLRPKSERHKRKRPFIYFNNNRNQGIAGAWHLD